MIFHAHQAAVGDLPDDHGVESPFLEDGEHFVFSAIFGDKQHALLRFAEHDFVGRHSRFALRNSREIDFDAGAAARGHFRRGARETRRAHVLNRDNRAGLHGFEAGFEQQLFHEGIADLDVGAFLLRLFGEFGGGEQRGAVNSVAPRFCPDVNYGIADAFGFSKKNLLLPGDTEREGVHQRILRIARLEADFPADSGDAKTISVVGNAANHAIKDAAVLRGFLFARILTSGDFTKTQRVEHGDGPRTHAENVAQDATHAGRGALKRFHVTRMIVRFDFERRDETIADVHDARVFSRALHDELAARGQALQVHFARFVGAVLAPHHAEDAQLRDVRIAPEDLFDARVFFGGEAVFGGDLGRNFDFGSCGSHQAVAFAAPTSASTMERKIVRPSVEPSAASTARSGCGMRPATLRPRLQMPAML